MFKVLSIPAASSPFYRQLRVKNTILHCFSVYVQDQNDLSFMKQQDALDQFLSNKYDFFISQSPKIKPSSTSIPVICPEPTDKESYEFLNSEFEVKKFIYLYVAQEIENLFRRGVVALDNYPEDLQLSNIFKQVKQRVLRAGIPCDELDHLLNELKPSSLTRKWCLEIIDPHTNPLTYKMWNECRLNRLYKVVEEVCDCGGSVGLYYTKSNVEKVIDYFLISDLFLK